MQRYIEDAYIVIIMGSAVYPPYIPVTKATSEEADNGVILCGVR